MNKNDMRNLWVVLSGASVGAPAGHVYATVMDRLSHQDFETACGQAVSLGLVTRAPSHLLGITDKGRTILAKINAMLDAVKAGA